MSKNQSKNKKQAEVQRPMKFTNFGFWFPILYGALNIIIMFMAIPIIFYGAGEQNQELARLIAQIFTVLCEISPTAFILLMYIDRRHKKKYSTAPSYYKTFPGMFGIMAVLIEVLYLVIRAMG